MRKLGPWPKAEAVHHGQPSVFEPIRHEILVAPRSLLPDGEVLPISLGTRTDRRRSALWRRATGNALGLVEHRQHHQNRGGRRKIFLVFRNEILAYRKRLKRCHCAIRTSAATSAGPGHVASPDQVSQRAGSIADYAAGPIA